MLLSGNCVLLRGEQICIVDVPRDQVFRNYKTLEMLKGGLLADTKCGVNSRSSKTLFHVVVFATCVPDTASLTASLFFSHRVCVCVSSFMCACIFRRLR